MSVIYSSILRTTKRNLITSKTSSELCWHFPKNNMYANTSPSTSTLSFQKSSASLGDSFQKSETKLTMPSKIADRIQTESNYCYLCCKYANSTTQWSKSSRIRENTKKSTSNSCKRPSVNPTMTALKTMKTGLNS